MNIIVIVNTRNMTSSLSSSVLIVEYFHIIINKEQYWVHTSAPTTVVASAYLMIKTIILPAPHFFFGICECGGLIQC